MNRIAATCWVGWALLGASAGWAQQTREVYRCPGNPVLYTDSLSAKEAREKGCTPLVSVPITVVGGTGPRPPVAAKAPSAGAPRSSSSNSNERGSSQRSSDERVSASEQRARDSDARRILEAELKREEQQLTALQKEYNNGEPERRGDERNYQKYVDRVAEMKAGIARKEADIAAIKRELGKLPQ
jgi:hypothetical protein